MHAQRYFTGLKLLLRTYFLLLCMAAKKGASLQFCSTTKKTVTQKNEPWQTKLSLTQTTNNYLITLVKSALTCHLV